MAFRQVIINMDGFRATELLNATSLDYNPGTLWSRPFTDGTDLYSKATSENVPVTLFDTGIFKMVATLTDSLKHLNEKFYYNQNQIINNNSGNRYITFTGFAFGVDDDTELGTLWICVTVDGGEYGVTRLASPSHDLYLGILSAQPDPNKSGGAGSGYIGNSLLSNKKMVGFNVPTSSAEGTKTESVNEASENPVANKPKIGNGFARIKFLRAEGWGGYFFTDSFNPELIKSGWDLGVYRDGFGDGGTQWAPTQFSSDFLSSYNFLIGNVEKEPIILDNGILRRKERGTGASDGIFWIPINRLNGTLKSLELDYCNLSPRHGSYDAIALLIGWIDSNNGWHQAAAVWIDRMNNTEWQHGNYTNLSLGNTHIDYIGIYTCDGQPACKNIKLIVE